MSIVRIVDTEEGTIEIRVACIMTHVEALDDPAAIDVVKKKISKGIDDAIDRYKKGLEDEEHPIGFEP